MAVTYREMTYKTFGRVLAIENGIIWEGYRHDTKHQEWILADIMKKYPALLEMFPEHKAGDFFWGHREIIPFDAVIDFKCKDATYLVAQIEKDLGEKYGRTFRIQIDRAYSD